jgi:hypothetical protein
VGTRPATLDAATEVKPAEKAPQDDVQVVQLAPLTADQRRQFAVVQGVQDVAAFMDLDPQVFWS